MRSTASAVMSAHLDRARRSDIAGYLELHIEQGVVLQNNRIDLGLVTAIVGITRIEVVFEGAADHAGTTLMEYRKDASLAAAQLMLFVNERANALAARKQEPFRRDDRHSQHRAECIECRSGPRASCLRHPRRGSRHDRRIH